MAKSQLFASLRRMVTDARVARERNVSLETVSDWRAAAREQKSGVTRRQFVRGGAAAAAAGALFSTNANAANPKPTIAIVGAGIAGLNCALELKDRGYASTIYEAQPARVGGRMHSNVGHFNQGQVSEFCGELIDTGHYTIRDLADRFNLPMTNLLGAQPAGSEDTFYFDGQYYPRAQANIDFMPVYDVLVDQVRAAGYPTTYNVSKAAGRELDLISVYEWIAQYVPGGHSSPMGQLLDVAYEEEYAASTQVQSSLNLIYLLAYQPDPDYWEVFGESDEKFHIIGGNDKLPHAIANHLGPDMIKMGHALTKVKRLSDGRYRLSFAGKPDVTVDRAVLCIPFTILRTLDIAEAGFDDLKRYAIDNLGAGVTAKIALQFNTRLWNQPGPWGLSNGNVYSDTGLQNTWDVTRGVAGSNGVMVDYTGGPYSSTFKTTTPYAREGNAKVRQDAARFLAQLEPILPGITAQWNGKAACSLAHLDPYLKTSYSHWKVGHYQTYVGYEGVRQGNCLFAGEHTSVDYQGFMEGGAISGKAAAKDIINGG